MSMNIDIKELENVKSKLEELKDNDVIYIEEDGKAKYAVMLSNTYNKVDDLLDIVNDNNISNTKVKVIGSNEEITYEEYEKIKALIMEAVDKTFKPKAEKLN